MPRLVNWASFAQNAEPPCSQSSGLRQGGLAYPETPTRSCWVPRSRTEPSRTRLAEKSVESGSSKAFSTTSTSVISNRVQSLKVVGVRGPGILHVRQLEHELWTSQAKADTGKSITVPPERSRGPNGREQIRLLDPGLVSTTQYIFTTTILPMPDGSPPSLFLCHQMREAGSMPCGYRLKKRRSHSPWSSDPRHNRAVPCSLSFPPSLGLPTPTSTQETNTTSGSRFTTVTPTAHPTTTRLKESRLHPLGQTPTLSQRKLVAAPFRK